MTDHLPPLDPRINALARFLRQRAAAFSLSADVNDTNHTAEAGMVLLDAASLVEGFRSDHPTLRALSEAGLFESMPQGQVRVVSTPEVHRALQQPISGAAQDAHHVLSAILTALDQQ